VKKIIIFGSGDYSEVVLKIIIESKSYNLVGYIDIENKNTKNLKQLKYLGKIEQNKSLLNNSDISGIVAIGCNYIRKEVVDEVHKINNKFIWRTLKHPSVSFCDTSSVGEGSVIVTGVVINGRSKIGSHCLINTNSSLNHDNILDDFSSTGPGVNTGGNVLIGKYCYIGIGSSIKHNITIKNNTIIGAQSYVNSDCEGNSLYYGIPAKRVSDWIYGKKYL
jgi:sugar O-acyltransferase (sialic acid O-acetyltransferase NeuD family)|tara:strand:+ start:5310 stop:5969 length:660 start_codon:yes stop_codon:yes gene_type:complete